MTKQEWRIIEAYGSFIGTRAVLQGYLSLLLSRTVTLNEVDEVLARWVSQ